jgi:regulator of sigma E protease
MGAELASMATHKSTVLSAIPDATVEVWGMIKTISFYLGRLVTNQVPADQVSGIIGIGHTAGAVARPAPRARRISRSCRCACCLTSWC